MDVGQDATKMPAIPETILEEDEEEIEEDYEPKIESHTSAKITEVNEESPIGQEKLIESNENCAESINK